MSLKKEDLSKNMDVTRLTVFNISQAAKYAGVSHAVMNLWMSKKFITFYELPGKNGFKRMVRIYKKDLDEFLSKHRREAA